jgi:hypothetical protein
MGLVVKMVVAFFIGAFALSAAQKYWMSAMQTRINEVSSRTDWLPPSNPVVIDTSQMNRSFNQPMGRMGVIPATRP